MWKLRAAVLAPHCRLPYKNLKVEVQCRRPSEPDCSCRFYCAYAFRTQSRFWRRPSTTKYLDVCQVLPLVYLESSPTHACSDAAVSPPLLLQTSTSSAWIERGLGTQNMCSCFLTSKNLAAQNLLLSCALSPGFPAPGTTAYTLAPSLHQPQLSTLPSNVQVSARGLAAIVPHHRHNSVPGSNSYSRDTAAMLMLSDDRSAKDAAQASASTSTCLFGRGGGGGGRSGNTGHRARSRCAGGDGASGSLEGLDSDGGSSGPPRSGGLGRWEVEASTLERACVANVSLLLSSLSADVHVSPSMRQERERESAAF